MKLILKLWKLKIPGKGSKSTAVRRVGEFSGAKRHWPQMHNQQTITAGAALHLPFPSKFFGLLR